MSRRGWALARAAGLALVVALIAPVSPLVLVGVPLAVLLLAFRRQDVLSVGLAVLLVLLLFGDPTRAHAPLWYAERAWALILAGAFVVATVFRGEESLLHRGLAAVGVTALAVGAASVLRGSMLARLDWWVGEELSRAAGLAYGWLASQGGAAGPVADELGQAVMRAVDWQVLLYPGLLALASLASLAVGWFVVVRLSGREEALGPVRDFRFADGLVWLLVIGAVLLLLPLGETLDRLGQNAVVLMGGLYLLRGIGVLLWVGAAAVTSAWAAVAWVAAGVALYPLAVLVALVVGLGDTWMNVRARLGAVFGRGG